MAPQAAPSTVLVWGGLSRAVVAGDMQGTQIMLEQPLQVQKLRVGIARARGPLG